MLIDRIAKEVRHGYLEELRKRKGMEEESFYFLPRFDQDWIKEKRREEWNKEYKENGFLPAETWSLDFTMAALLYERLRFYQERVLGTVLVSNEKIHKYEGELLSEGEIVTRLISDLEIYLTSDGVDPAIEIGRRAWKMWSEVFPIMWW